MINIINQTRKSFALFKNIQYLFHRKPRSPDVPTQSSKLEPFSINYLHDNPGSRYTPKKLGRGSGSGKGYFSIDIAKQVAVVSRVTGLEREEDLMYVFREDKPLFKRDCLSMDEFFASRFIYIETPS